MSELSVSEKVLNEQIESGLIPPRDTSEQFHTFSIDDELDSCEGEDIINEENQVRFLITHSQFLFKYYSDNCSGW